MKQLKDKKRERDIERQREKEIQKDRERKIYRKIEREKGIERQREKEIQNDRVIDRERYIWSKDKFIKQSNIIQRVRPIRNRGKVRVDVELHPHGTEPIF